MFRKLCGILLICTMVLALSACSRKEKEMADGYYTAEAAEFSHGWKEFVTICVSNGQIVTVEYNAKNVSGFIKSWDIAYMEVMNKDQGTYPNRYTRTYASALLKNQSAEGIDMVTGATNSGTGFLKLAAAVVEKARAGDQEVAIIKTE